MRLGQLARKYDLSPQEIIDYLEKTAPTTDIIHPNAKLDDSTITLIAKYFQFSLEEKPEESLAQIDEGVIEVMVSETPEPEVNEAKELEELPQIETEVPLSIAEVKEEPLKKEHEVIETDRLLELMESEETSSVDLSKITLIKAPKKELGGLKVVGKIELVEPKIRATEKDNQQGRVAESNRKNENQHGYLNEEEREKRRLAAKRKQEEQEARKEARRKENEEKQKKALKEEHYRKKLERSKPNKSKIKGKSQLLPMPSNVEEPRPQPKTLMGRFWRWLNT